MNDISKSDFDFLFKNIPKKNSINVLVFSISLKEYEKQHIFFEDDDGELYQQGIERHISKISKKRYIRLSNNEYIFCVVEQDTPLDQIEKRILSELYRSIKIGDYLISIPYNIGSSKYPQDSVSFKTCIKYARVAKFYSSSKSIKYYAKHNLEEYTSSYEEFIIKNTLISAIHHDEIFIVYQPVFDSKKEKIIYIEALLRWEKEGISINPQKIIEISENNETIHILTEYVLEKVCKFQSFLKKKYSSIFPISVNISQSALANPKLPWKLSSLLKKYSLETSAIKLEITETTSSKNFSSIEYKSISPNDISEELIKRGFQLYADDFGVGFSNLEFISSHNFSGIKLDKFFIQKITHNKSKYFMSLIKSVLEFAKENNLVIICEGVETQEQLTLLTSLKLPFYVQGYFFSKPLSEKNLEKYYIKN